MIDFTDVLTDPELGARSLVCVRATQTLNNGRAVNTTSSTGFTGIVTQDKGAIVARIADGTYVEGSIMVHTYFALQNKDEPDVIVDPRDGARYLVTSLGNYAEHGFNWAIAEPYGVQ